MPSNPDDQVDIFEEVVYGADQSKEVVIETSRGELVFDLERVDRRTRNRVMSSLPEGFLDLDDDIDIDLDEVDGPDDIDVGDIDLGDLDLSSATLDDEATDAWDDMLVEGLSHDRLSDSEIRDLVERMPDPIYYEAGADILEFSMQGARIDGFRERA